MRGRIAALVGASILALGVLAGCGGSDDSASTPPSGTTATVTAESLEEAQQEAVDRMRSEIDQQVEEAMTATASQPAPPPRSGTYPRKVPIGEVALPTWAIEAMQGGSPFPDEAIEWEPGIYTRSAEPIGSLRDYSVVYGPCPEAARFARNIVSVTCTT